MKNKPIKKEWHKPKCTHFGDMKKLTGQPEQPIPGGPPMNCPPPSATVSGG
ncbi:MAG: hypothetical protein KJ804_18385 [Proteobacteria bacterium]|nr:hypothetical protein [Pseudomonadota bacterium]MBU1060277.1 hypothetical protein [Pseudomonadota bacterium]